MLSFWNPIKWSGERLTETSVYSHVNLCLQSKHIFHFNEDYLLLPDFFFGMWFSFFSMMMALTTNSTWTRKFQLKKRTSKPVKYTWIEKKQQIFLSNSLTPAGSIWIFCINLYIFFSVKCSRKREKIEMKEKWIWEAGNLFQLKTKSNLHTWQHA